MKTLTFRPGHGVRGAHFEDRSTLAVSAACLVANAARDVLANAFGCPVEMRLFEPIVPTTRGWDAIARGARTYAVGGLRTDAVIVLRGSDAVAIARSAFGEFCDRRGALSAMEDAVLDRIVASLAQVLPALAGRSAASVNLTRCESIPRCTTFFEMYVVRPVEARIGIALARDPQVEVQPEQLIETLHGVQVDLQVASAPVILAAGMVAALEPGDVVPMMYTSGSPFELRLAGRTLARGECGVMGNRYALRISE